MGQACCEASPTTIDLRKVPSKNGYHQIKRQQGVTGRVTKEDFIYLKVVGIGSYGKVFLVEHKGDGQHYAMKVVKKELVYETMQEDGISTERDILARFDHPFIMKLAYAFQDMKCFYMAMEFVNGGELFYHLHMFNAKGFELERAKFYAA